MKLRYVISVASVLGAVLSFNLQQEAKANVADDLNQNYNNIVDNCGSSDKPAYECSGNLVRLTSKSKYNVWDPSPTSASHQAVSFTYLRHDIKVNLGFGDNLSGIIYYPSLLNPSEKESAEVTCAFPMDGWTWGRSDGCKRVADNKTCQDLDIHTAEGWYQDFMSRSLTDNVRYNYQCGFAMTTTGQNVAQDFNENLKIIKEHFGETMLKADGGKFINPISEYNEIIVKPLPNKNSQITNPEKLPIQAFFYMVKNGKSGLSDAQYYQQQYYQKAHVLVPIVKLDNDDVANTSFSYNPDDRGVNVADELNANYNKVVDNCGSKDKPAFQCSGILLRQTLPSSSYHVWDPNPKSIQYGGVSFSYIRKDLQLRNLLHTDNRNSGFIYYPSQQEPSDVESAIVSCFFPTGADTDSRPDGRCGAYTSYPKSSIECQQQSIYTADDWYKKFSNPAIVGYEKFFSQCGFNVSSVDYDIATAFSEGLKAHNLAEANTISTRGGIDEIIIKTQSTDASGKSVHPDQLPLQAFYYQNATGLTEAQKYQQDYYDTTGKIVPVVYMNTTDFNNISFSYFAADQVINKGADTVKELTNNYNKTVDNCGSADKVSSNCSGNIIRFTSYSDKFKVWDPSPAAVGRKGVSFMYVRQDLPLDKSFKNKTSGLIYYPTQEKPLAKAVNSIRCAYPVDGYTDRRYTNGENDACGATVKYPSDSQPCQDQGITTGQAWYNHFAAIPDVDKNRLQHQCGFSLSSNEQNLGDIFKAVIDGQKILQTERGSANYDELVLAIPSYNKVTDAEGNVSYTINDPKALPIEAFFYTNATGLTEAQGYQKDYLEATGMYVPVVKFDLDVDTGKVTYTYNQADQTNSYNQNNS